MSPRRATSPLATGCAGIQSAVGYLTAVAVGTRARVGLCLGALLVLAAFAPASGLAGASSGGPRIHVLSNRADVISGGDALVR